MNPFNSHPADLVLRKQFDCVCGCAFTVALFHIVLHHVDSECVEATCDFGEKNGEVLYHRVPSDFYMQPACYKF